MLILATALPLAHLEDGRIVLSVPSGKKDRVEIALTVNQALFAHQALLNVACEAMGKAIEPEAAKVITLPAGRRKSGRR